MQYVHDPQWINTSMTTACCTVAQHTQRDTWVGKTLEVSRNHNTEKAKVQLLGLRKPFWQFKCQKALLG